VAAFAVTAAGTVSTAAVAMLPPETPGQHCQRRKHAKYNPILNLHCAALLFTE